MRGLIVTADGLGFDPETNRGILEAHEKGVVTGASVVGNGMALEHAVQHLRRSPKLFAGFHLNLSEGEPVARGHRTLAGSDGRFLGVEGIRAALKKGLIDRGEVQREAAAQLERLRGRGLAAAHLDSLGHIHVWPLVRDALAEVCRAYRFRTVRIPGEPDGSPDLAAMSRRARVVYRHYGVASPAKFRGAALEGRFSREALFAVLEKAPQGWTELMTHPGHPNPAAGGSSGAERKKELDVLADPAVREWILDRFELGTYERATA